MNASVVKRTVVITALVAVSWIGCSWWSSRREAAEKAALAAEIRVDLEALPREPDRRPGRVDLTAEYAAVRDAVGEKDIPDDYWAAPHDSALWTTVPAVMESFVADSGSVYEALEGRVERAPPGFVVQDSARRLPGMTVRCALQARARMRGWRGEWSGALRTVRLMFRIADDLEESSSPGDPIGPQDASAFESMACEVLEEFARRPTLPEAAAVEALEISGARGDVRQLLEGILSALREDRMRFWLELLEGDGEEVLRDRGLVKDVSMIDNVERFLSGKERKVRKRPPSAEAIRRAREYGVRISRAIAERDVTYALPEGGWDREGAVDLGRGWIACRLGLNVGVRTVWRIEARLPVLRAALAVRVFEARTGRLPTALGELVPSILPAVPVDPWTGEPVKFTPRPGGRWLLESGPPEAEVDLGNGVTRKSEPHRLEK